MKIAEQPHMANFDRDFGYLMPFLDKIEEAVPSAPPGAQAELSELVRGEKSRWQRIQALLADGGKDSAGKRENRSADSKDERRRAGAEPASTDVAPTRSAVPSTGPRTPSASAERSPRGTFTVGSLRGR